MSYKTLQRQYQIDNFIHRILPSSERATTTHNHILEDGFCNLYPDIRNAVEQYFNENNITWWHGNKPTGNILSSQIACLNHLFPIRSDKAAILQILNSLTPNEPFTDLIPLGCDSVKGVADEHSYISFEVTSSQKLGGERCRKRGSNCTSIDAACMAQQANGTPFLIFIEWKYVECYYTKNVGDGTSGLLRNDSYDALLRCCPYFKPEFTNQPSDIFYHEPFYQLMRQTLLANQYITKNNPSMHFWHLHGIPSGNYSLLGDYKYSGHNLHDTWKNMLTNPNAYTIVSPSTLFAPLTNIDTYTPLIDYLSNRYWQNP